MKERFIFGRLVAQKKSVAVIIRLATGYGFFGCFALVKTMTTSLDIGV